MNDEEFKKLCEDFNKMEGEIKEMTLIFSNVDNHLHKVCDEIDKIAISGDNNVKQEKNKQL